jgi:Transcriptional regulators
MERLAGYIAMLKKSGLIVKNSLIEHCNYTGEDGYRACKNLLKNNPNMTALFATNYDVTIGAMMAVNEYGLSVPEDLSVFGFDDMPFAQVINPHLSVIAQPVNEIGKHASQMLLIRMDRKADCPAKVTVLSAHAVIRDSVAACRTTEIN